MDPRTDAQLVDSLRFGTNDAFEELYHRYKRLIYTFCLKLTGDRFLAEDATHDCFIKMHQNINTLIDNSVFRSWLCAIARNQVYKNLK